jgi:hypothetical protein
MQPCTVTTMTLKQSRTRRHPQHKTLPTDLYSPLHKPPFRLEIRFVGNESQNRIVNILTRFRAEQSGVRFLVGVINFVPLQNTQTGSGIHQASSSMSTGATSWGQSGRDVKLTTNLHLAPKQEWVELYLYIPHELMAWSGEKLTFLHLKQKDQLGTAWDPFRIASFYHLPAPTNAMFQPPSLNGWTSITVLTQSRTCRKKCGLASGS